MVCLRRRALLDGWMSAARRGEGGAPSEFVCPITHEVMTDPVVASDGMTYERQAIREVLDRGNGLSPLTREVLARDVFPNFGLRKCILNWQAAADAADDEHTSVAVQGQVPSRTARRLSVALLSAGVALLVVGWAGECACTCH